MFEDSTTTNDEWFLVVDEFGCDVMNCNLAISEIQEDKDILIYPNPASSDITIRISSENTDNILNICNSLGEIVLTKRFHGNQTYIDISNIPAGIYGLNIISGNKIYSEKVVIER